MPNVKEMGAEADNRQRTCVQEAHFSQSSFSRMGSGGSSPKRRSALSQNNHFMPADLRNYSGALPEGIDGNGNGTPSLGMRVPTRKEIATLGSGQEVLWLNENGVEVSIDEPGRPSAHCLPGGSF